MSVIVTLWMQGDPKKIEEHAAIPEAKTSALAR